MYTEQGIFEISQLSYTVSYLRDNLNIESGKIVQNLRSCVSFVTMLEGIIQFILFFIFADNGRRYPGADIENN